MEKNALSFEKGRAFFLIYRNYQAEPGKEGMPKNNKRNSEKQLTIRKLMI